MGQEAKAGGYKVKTKLMKSENSKVVTFLIGLVLFQLFVSIVTLVQVGTDRRDVNRDGQVNLVDLSVLAVEISEENKAK